jgi:hypothetical protein
LHLGPLALSQELDERWFRQAFKCTAAGRRAIYDSPWETQIGYALPEGGPWALHPAGKQRIAELVQARHGSIVADSPEARVTYFTASGDETVERLAVQAAIYLRNLVGLDPATIISIDIVNANLDSPPDPERHLSIVR